MEDVVIERMTRLIELIVKASYGFIEEIPFCCIQASSGGPEPMKDA